MADYTSESWCKALGGMPKTPHPRYVVYHTNGSVRIFTSELRRAQYLAQALPGTVDHISLVTFNQVVP